MNPHGNRTMPKKKSARGLLAEAQAHCRRTPGLEDLAAQLEPLLRDADRAEFERRFWDAVRPAALVPLLREFLGSMREPVSNPVGTADRLDKALRELVRAPEPRMTFDEELAAEAEEIEAERAAAAKKAAGATRDLARGGKKQRRH